MSRADRWILAIAVALTVGFFAAGQAHYHSVAVVLDRLTLDEGATRLCSEVTVENLGPRDIRLDHWVVSDGSSRSTVSSPVDVGPDSSGTSKLCLPRAVSCAPTGRRQLESVETTADAVDSGPRVHPLGWSIPCRGWVLAGGDERALHLFDAVHANYADSPAFPAELTEVARGQPVSAVAWAKVQEAVAADPESTAPIDPWIDEPVLRIGLPTMAVALLMLGGRQFGRVGVAEGLVAMEHGDADGALGSFVRIARFGAVIARSESWEGRELLRAVYGEPIASFAATGFDCLDRSGPENAAFLARFALALSDVRSRWADAFDLDALYDARSRRLDRVGRSVDLLAPVALARSIGTADVSRYRGPILRRWKATMADLALEEVALAARRFRLAQRALPAALERLVPEWMESLPADPFRSDGATLGYRANADGSFVVWSVGDDAVDDRGDATKDQVLAVGASPQACVPING